MLKENRISDDIRTYVPYLACRDAGQIELCMVDGMLWIPRDMIILFAYTGEKISYKALHQRVDDFVAQHPQWQHSVREFQLKTDGGLGYKAKFYDINLSEAIMRHYGTLDEQFITWAKVQIGELPQEQLDTLVQSLKHDDELLAAKYHYSWIDRLWYCGERLVDNSRGPDSGGSLFMWCIAWLAMGILLPIEHPAPNLLRCAVYVVIAIALYFIYRKHFTPERRQAIYVHYGLPVKRFSRLKSVGIVIGIMCVGILFVFLMTEILRWHPEFWLSMIF